MGASDGTDRCLVCNSLLKPFINDIEDWEYGVGYRSQLVRCDHCGLVTHDPQVKRDAIPSLYPSNYLAHSPTASSKGFYGATKNALRRLAARRISQSLPDNGRFLEVGCGNGQLIRDLAQLRQDVDFMGVDIERVEMPKMKRFEFLHGQLEDVHIDAGSVDVLYCSNLIEHVADPRLFLGKVHDILRPGGVLLGVTPDHLSLDRLVFGRYWAGYHYPRHTFVFNHRNLPTLLRQEGFEQIHVSGSHSFWYLSLANRFVELPGTKKRGALFALTSAMFLPLDLTLNLFTTHGSMRFDAKRT